jgi:hypothetical protein
MRPHSALIRETAWAVFLTIALITLTTVAFFILPHLVVSAHDLQRTLPAPRGASPSPTPTIVDLVQAQNGVRTAAVALLAGLGAALAAGFSARTYYLSRQSQLDLSYSTAVGQLDAEQISVQISAISELGRIARRHPSRHQQIMSVLAAFICGFEREAHSVVPPLTLQAACDELMQRDIKRDGNSRLNLSGADLRQVNLENAQLRRAILRDTQLGGAFLRSGDLREADFTNARAKSTRFDGSQLDDATLDGVDLTAATLDCAHGSKATFVNAIFKDTFMRKAKLVDCPGLRRADGSAQSGIIESRTQPATDMQTPDASQAMGK